MKAVEVREWLVNRLSRNLKSSMSLAEVLVIGGSNQEPELNLIDRNSSQVIFAGVEKNGENLWLDLNLPNEINSSFNLIICNQVFEHLYNTQEAFLNLSLLCQQGGHVWLTMPSSNFRHGSPSYYASGYSKEFIETNMKMNGFKIIDSGELCCERVYLFRHLLKIWPSQTQLRFPLFSYFGISGSLFEKLIFNILTVPRRLIIAKSSKKMHVNSEYAIETFGFFQKL